MRTRARERAARIGWLMAGAVVLFAAVPRCIAQPAESAATQPAEPALVMKGWSLTADQVAAEYAQRPGAAPFDSLDSQAREEFARTLADRELLLRLAKASGVVPTGARARTLRVATEKSLLREYFRVLREHFQLSPEREAHDIAGLSREARVNQVFVTDPVEIARITAELDSGRAFPDVARAFLERRSVSHGDPIPPSFERVVRVDQRQASPKSLTEILLRELTPGTVVTPQKVGEGTLFLQFLEYRAIPQASDSTWSAGVRGAVRSLAWMDRSAQQVDSLHRASGLVFHPEAYPLLVERFAASADSIQELRTQGIAFDFTGIRAPTWRFTAEEQSRPLFEMWGKTYTVGDYVAGLNDTDVEFWPAPDVVEKTQRQVEARADRILFTGEAAKEGIDRSEAFLQAMAPIREKALLDEYYASAATSVPEPPADSLRVAYQRLLPSLQLPEALSYSILSFPGEKEAAARAVHEKLLAGGSWEELAAAAEKGEGAWYLPRTLLRDTKQPAFRPEWVDYWTAALKLQQGETSDVVKGTKGGFFLVRAVERRPGRDKTFEEARPSLVQRLASGERDKILDGLLQEQRTVQELKVFPHRLAGWQRSAAKTGP